MGPPTPGGPGAKPASAQEDHLSIAHMLSKTQSVSVMSLEQVSLSCASPHREVWGPRQAVLLEAVQQAPVQQFAARCGDVVSHGEIIHKLAASDDHQNTSRQPRDDDLSTNLRILGLSRRHPIVRRRWIRRHHGLGGPAGPAWAGVREESTLSLLHTHSTSSNVQIRYDASTSVGVSVTWALRDRGGGLRFNLNPKQESKLPTPPAYSSGRSGRATNAAQSSELG